MEATTEVLMPKNISETQLHHRSGSSDKIYCIAVIQEDNGSYSTPFGHGRRGAGLKYGYKAQNTSRLQAEQAFNKQVTKELTRSDTPYVRSPGICNDPFKHLTNASSSVTAPIEQGEATGIEVQLLSLVDDKDIQMYLTSPLYGAIAEHSGERRVSVLSDEFFMSNRKGYKVPCPQPVATALGKTGFSSMKVDGKLIGNHFYAFDLLEVNGIDYQAKPYFSRFRTLTSLFSAIECEHFSIIPLAISCFDKTNLYERLLKDGKDGVVFVPLSSTYNPGKSETGGPMLKRFIITSQSPF